MPRPQKQQKPLADLRPSAPPRRKSALTAIFIAAFALRLMFAASRQLVPDEAFYWVLSRHPHPGYLDHPPMVAWIIRLGTTLLGSSELGVRAVGCAMAFGTLLIILDLARKLTGQDRATWYLAAIWLTSPMLALLATIVTPDTPSIFFSTCALACAVKLASNLDTTPDDRLAAGPDDRSLTPDRTWLLLGLFTGLSLLAKYTAVLPAFAIVAALLTTPRGRAQFRRPGPWAAAAIALVVFYPVIYWNATHGWASFKYQLHHGMAAADADAAPRSHLASLLTYVGGQFGAFTPVLFVFAVAVLGIFWARYRSLDPSRRILVWSATVPLVFFALTALKSGAPGEMNWPAFAYFPMSVLLVDHVAARWKRSDVVWLQVGCGVALAVLVALHVPEKIFAIGIVKKHATFPRKLNEMYGWKEFGRAAGAQPELLTSFLVAGRHQDAAELSFYLPGQPTVWCYPTRDAAGRPVERPTSFDYFPERPDLATIDRVAYVGGHPEAFRAEYGYEIAGWWSFTMPINGKLRERSIAFMGRNLPQAIPSPTTRPTTRGHHHATTATAPTTR